MIKVQDIRAIQDRPCFIWRSNEQGTGILYILRSVGIETGVVIYQIRQIINGKVGDYNVRLCAHGLLWIPRPIRR